MGAVWLNNETPPRREAARLGVWWRLAIGMLSLAIGAAAVLGTVGHKSGATESAGAPIGVDALQGEPEFSGELELTQDELAEWNRIIASPDLKSEVVSGLQRSFGSLATVGAGSEGTERDEPDHGSAVNRSSLGDLELVLAYGINSTHVWMTASYADMARGAIWAAVNYCKRYVPSWLCTFVGNKLTEWARGWGSGNNHGVWAAVYWAPPHYSGGRW